MPTPTTITSRLLFGQVTWNPDPNALPGGTTLQTIVNGVGYFVFIAILAAFLISCGAWAFGAISSNPRASSLGKTGAGGSVIAALLLGAAAAIINFFFGVGGGVSST